MAITPKQYEPPRLVVIGTVADLTRAVGNKGPIDGGTSPMHRTSAQ